jgi:hypothetical protein
MRMINDESLRAAVIACGLDPSNADDVARVRNVLVTRSLGASVIGDASCLRADDEH